MPLRIDQYRQYVLERKFTQNPSFYTMNIMGGGIKNDGMFECYPDSILLPGRNFLNTPFSYFGPEYSIPLRREYSDLSANFIVYQDWKERQFFENWMDSILPYKTFNTSSGPLVSDIFPENFISQTRDISITFKSRPVKENTYSDNYVFDFVNAYPTLITPTAFSADNSGYTVFTVNFSYRYYRTSNNTVNVQPKGL